MLGYWDWRDGLRRGIAAHHAGLMPAFKETVEDLFVRGLVRAVFATETLALGINMPARSVVLERLTKFNGETHADVTPGEYTQLTGRAGRRGIDVEGHAVVLWAPELDPRRVAGLASTRTYPLRSSFRPSYNMAVNLVGPDGPPRRPRAARLVVRAVPGRPGGGRPGCADPRNEATLREYEQQMTCDLGDFTEYAALRRRLSDREAEISRAGARARRGTVAASLEALRPATSSAVPSGRRAGLAVVLDAGVHPKDDPRPLVVTEARWGGRLSMIDFPVAAEVLGSVRLPRSANYRSPQDRRDLAARICARSTSRTSPGGAARRAPARPTTRRSSRCARQLRSHPCHACPDREQHARWGERYARLTKENDGLRRRIEGRTCSLGRTFDRICTLLDDRGYLAADETAPPGRQLARIWSEADLRRRRVPARRGVGRAGRGRTRGRCLDAWSTSPAATRRRSTGCRPMPSAPRWRRRCGSGLISPTTSKTMACRAVANPSWASSARCTAGPGASDWTGCSTPAAHAELTAGDFIRWCKQVVDLLEQVAVAPAADGEANPLAVTARRGDRRRSAAVSSRRACNRERPGSAGGPRHGRRDLGVLT